MTPYSLEKKIRDVREIRDGLPEGASLEAKLSLALNMLETLLQHEADKEAELTLERRNRS